MIRPLKRPNGNKPCSTSPFSLLLLRYDLWCETSVGCSAAHEAAEHYHNPFRLQLI